MSRIYLSLVIAALLLMDSAGFAASHIERGNMVFEDIPDLGADPADALHAYLSAREAMPLGFTPKGQLLIVTRFGDVDQLHLVDHPGGQRRQITFLPDPITHGAFSPDPNRNAFLFAQDPGGSGDTQIYYQRMGEPGAHRLTDGKSVNAGALWSNSGREIAFFSTARDGMSFDIDIVDPESGALPHLAITGDGTPWYPLDWSPDDLKLLVLKYVSVAEGYLYVVDLNTGQKREVDPGAAKWASPMRNSPATDRACI